MLSCAGVTVNFPKIERSVKRRVYGSVQESTRYCTNVNICFWATTHFDRRNRQQPAAGGSNQIVTGSGTPALAVMLEPLPRVRPKLERQTLNPCWPLMAVLRQRT